MKSNKKGQALNAMSLMGGLAIILAVAIIAASVMTQVVDDFQANQVTATCIEADDNANCSLAFNATNNGLLGMESFSDNFTTIGTVAGAVVLISLVVGGLEVFVARRLA